MFIVAFPAAPASPLSPPPPRPRPAYFFSRLPADRPFATAGGEDGSAQPGFPAPLFSLLHIYTFFCQFYFIFRSPFFLRSALAMARGPPCEREEDGG